MPFRERQSGRSPSSLSVGTKASQGVVAGTIPADELMDWLKANLESATPMGSTDPRVRRTLPVAHPRCPWLFLDGVSAQGIEYVEPVDADPDGALEAPPLDEYAEYAEYHLNLQFGTRPYAVLKDGQIPVESLTWTQEDGTTQTVRYAKEWFRYIEWLPEPAAEYLTAEQGQFIYRPTGTPGTGSDPVSAARGQIRLLQRSRTWRLRWHKVPAAFVLSAQARFDVAQGCVNQFEWEGFSPGHALLQSVRVLETYPPPFPEFVNYTGADVVSQEKLVDLEFVFLEARREAAVAFTPSNANHIVGGHNLVPFALTRKYYYVETQGTGGSDKQPIYPSYPFELLFSNPEVS